MIMYKEIKSLESIIRDLKTIFLCIKLVYNFLYVTVFPMIFFKYNCSVTSFQYEMQKKESYTIIFVCEKLCDFWNSFSYLKYLFIYIFILFFLIITINLFVPIKLILLYK